MATPLECKHCAAPLPSPGASPFVVCSYCGTTHHVGAPKLELAPTPPTQSDYDRMYERVRTEAPAAWDEARSHSEDPAVAVRAVVAAHSFKLRDECENERAARLAESLLRGFDEEHSTRTLHDQAAVLRMAEAVVKAVVELRTVTETDINLPFFTATDEGPLHLRHGLTRTALAGLDGAGGVEVKVVEQAATEAPPPEKPKKRRRWWPFGD